MSDYESALARLADLGTKLELTERALETAGTALSTASREQDSIRRLHDFLEQQRRVLCQRIEAGHVELTLMGRLEDAMAATAECPSLTSFVVDDAAALCSNRRLEPAEDDFDHAQASAATSDRPRDADGSETPDAQSAYPSARERGSRRRADR